MTSPLYISRDELMASKGIGGSDVAAIMHEDPWRSAYLLWQIKTGRAEKPPQTAAMKFGAEMEETAFQAYLNESGESGKGFEKQVIAKHAELSFLRAIADGWRHSDGRGVEIKVPTSRRLIEEVSVGNVPRNYQLQMAAMMAIFGVEEWDFYVYDAEKKRGELALVALDDLFGSRHNTLGNFWKENAVPAIVEFWRRVKTDSWIFENGSSVTPPEVPWLDAIGRRISAMRAIRAAEEEKDKAESEIKRLMGGALAASAGGWKAQYKHYQPSCEAIVKLESAEVLNGPLKDILAALGEAAGVKEVKINQAPDSYRFSVTELTKG